MSFRKYTIQISLILIFISCRANEWGKTSFDSLDEALINKSVVRELVLTNDSQYTSIPQSIFELKELEKLYFFGLECDVIRDMYPCQFIEEIPKEIAALTKLKRLSLPGHRIASIPIHLKDLESLKVLDLTFNRGVDISKIGHLTNLEELQLNDCGLGSIPNSIKNLKNLKKLGLRMNLISDVEKEKIKLLLPECEIAF